MSADKMPSHHGIKSKLSGEYPNETMRILTERASCRVFKAKKIPDKVMNTLFEVATHAATGGNLQPYSIIKITDQKVKDDLAKKCEQAFIGQAPVDLLFCIDWYRLKRWAELSEAPYSAQDSFRHFWISFQDTIIAAQNICTAADAMGLGSVYIGTVLEYFRPLKKMFDLPEGVFPVVLLCLGYPKSKLVPRRKLPIDMIVHDEKYHRRTDKEISAAFESKYPNVKIQLTPERLETFAEVCRVVHGERFAGHCLARVKERGYFTMAQRYFGLHYMASLMPVGNHDYLKIFEEYGFGWFKKWSRERYSPYKDEYKNG
jgi:nitroreductase